MKKAVRHSGNLQELSGMIATEGGNAIDIVWNNSCPAKSIVDWIPACAGITDSALDKSHSSFRKSCKGYPESS